jgi:hypothetical protein
MTDEMHRIVALQFFQLFCTVQRKSLSMPFGLGAIWDIVEGAGPA